MYPTRWFVVACCFLGATVDPAIALDSGARPVGWRPSADFVEVPGRHGDTVVAELHLKGERPDDWRERVRVLRMPRASVASPAEAHATVLDAMRSACPAYHDLPIPKPEGEIGPPDIVLWFCPKHAEGGGRAGFVRAIAADDAWFLMLVEGRYANFSRKHNPITSQQEQRWVPLIGTFSLCEAWTTPGCAPDAAALMTAGARLRSEVDEAEIAPIEARGVELFQQDQLAWHATDFAIENKAIDPTQSRPDGAFVAVPGTGKSGISYFLFGGAKPELAAAVSTDAEGRMSMLARDLPIPEDVRARYEALLLARAQNPVLCERAVNSAVLRTEDGNGWWVYVMSASSQAGVMVLGGHTRFRIDGERKQVQSTERSAKSCIALDLAQMRKLSDGSAGDRPLNPVVSHLVSDTPWETHVFQSLTFDTPLLVLTRRAAWRIDGGRIARLDID